MTDVQSIVLVMQNVLMVVLSLMTDTLVTRGFVKVTFSLVQPEMIGTEHLVLQMILRVVRRKDVAGFNITVRILIVCLGVTIQRNIRFSHESYTMKIILIVT